MIRTSPKSRRRASMPVSRAVARCRSTATHWGLSMRRSSRPTMTAIDYAAIAAALPIIIDTRNVFAKLGIAGENVVKA